MSNKKLSKKSATAIATFITTAETIRQTTGHAILSKTSLNDILHMVGAMIEVKQNLKDQGYRAGAGQYCFTVVGGQTLIVHMYDYEPYFSAELIWA